MGLRLQGLPPAVQLREKDWVLTTPLPDRLAGDALRFGDFAIELAEDQKIDGVLLLGDGAL